MLTDNLRLLLQLYVRPARALSGILDEGSLLFAPGRGAGRLPALRASRLPFRCTRTSRPSSGAPQAACAGASARAWRRAVRRAEASLRCPTRHAARNRRHFLGRFLTTSVVGALFALAALYVPGCILAATFVASVGSFGVAFRRDYGSLLVCALFSWAAPTCRSRSSVWGWGWRAWALGLDLASLARRTALTFGFCMVLSLRTVFGPGGRARRSPPRGLGVLRVGPPSRSSAAGLAVPALLGLAVLPGRRVGHPVVVRPATELQAAPPGRDPEPAGRRGPLPARPDLPAAPADPGGDRALHARPIEIDPGRGGRALPARTDRAGREEATPRPSATSRRW